MDRSRSSEADVLADLERGLPFRDGVFNEVWMSHVFEHVAEPLALMEEIWRVCSEGALVEIRGPHFSSPHLVWGDPTHRRGLTMATFVCFSVGSDWYLTKARFSVCEAHLIKGDTHLGDVRLRVWYWPFVFWNKAWQWAINLSVRMILRYERLLGRFIAFQELRVILKVHKDKARNGRGA